MACRRLLIAACVAGLLTSIVVFDPCFVAVAHPNNIVTGLVTCMFQMCQGRQTGGVRNHNKHYARLVMNQARLRFISTHAYCVDSYRIIPTYRRLI